MSPTLAREVIPQPAGPHFAPRKLAAAKGLRIGPSHDAFEREADRVANAVMTGNRLPDWSVAKVRSGQIQRQAPSPTDQATPAPKPNNYKDAAEKLGEAFLKTDLGKKLKDAASQDPLVKGAESFLDTLPGKIVAGAAATGVVTTLAATHQPLPVQIPEIPLDKIRPGLKVKITYEGPVDHPTKAMVTFSYSPQGEKKKSAHTDSERYRAETARMAADLEKFRAGLKYEPGSPQAQQQVAEQKMIEDWTLHRFGAVPGTGGRPLVPPQAQQQSAGGLQLQMPEYQSPYGLKAPSLMDKKLELEPITTSSAATLQRKAAGPAEADVAPPVVDYVLDSPGQPLDKATREFFELRLGYDFSKIRIHADAQADESARAVNALAYTVGDRIAFAAGRYSPHSSEGRRLLAHELVHAVQQGQRVSLAPRGAAGVGPAISRSHHLKVARAPGPQGGQSAKSEGNTGGNIRIVRLDNNVIAEIGRGNANVANTLRQLARDPNVKLEMSRGVYQETTRVTGDMLAARKALIDKLNIRIVDEPLAQRVPTYERYAQSPDFPTHGQAKVTGGEAATLEDLPHIASAAAGGKDVELWTFDARVQTNAARLGVKVAPESKIAINKNLPDSYLNIIKLVPEVTPSDVKGPGSSGGKGGGGALPPPPEGGGGQGTGGSGGAGASATALAPLAEGTETRPASPGEILARQKVISDFETETAESVRFSTRLQVYGAVFGGLMQIYSAFNTVTDAMKFSTDGTMFGKAQANANKLANQSAQDLDNATKVTGGISLLSAVAAVSAARQRGDSDALFDLSGSLGDFGVTLLESADHMTDMAERLDARVKGLKVMEDYFEKMTQLPIDPMAGTIPQSNAFEMYVSIGKFIGPLMTASSNYKQAATTLSYYGNYTSDLAHEAYKSAWTLVLRRLAQAQKAAAAHAGTQVAPQAPPPAVQHTGGTPQDFPSIKEQQGTGCHHNCHRAAGEPPNLLAEQKHLDAGKREKDIPEWMLRPQQPAPVHLGTHATPPGVHLESTQHGFPSEAEQRGKIPCQTCHPSHELKGPSDLSKPMTQEEAEEMMKLFYK